MPISQQDFIHLCTLSRLSPPLSEQEKMKDQCSRILDYMDKLSEIDTGNVEPLYSPAVQSCYFREDVAVRRSSHEAILADAPQTDGTFFIVPRIVEGK